MDLLEKCSNLKTVAGEILSSIQACVVLTNLKGEIIYGSSSVEKVLGFTPGELSGKNFSAFLTPEDLHYLYPNLLYMAGRYQPFEGELMLKRKNGTRFFAFFISRTCTDHVEGKPSMMICIQDIDRLKQHEKTLRQTSYNDLIRVADGIAHELRNPLVGIGGFVSKLYRSCRTAPVHDKYYEYIMDNLKKIEALVKEVEFFARLPKPGFLEESIREVIEEALQPHYQEIKARKIDLSTNVKETTLFVDADLTAKAFSMLIQNALDAIAGKGSLSIFSETGENQCKVYVRDTGCGISREDIPHIFDPFFSTKTDRVGISLAVVKRIMNLHGGQVEVASNEGGGTTFLLIFPVERRRPIRVSLLGSASCVDEKDESGGEERN